ncbi:uncharacterized protein TNCV_829441 [Trichonephila clavipes]|nr:uncharacterized protein TNCV_829441 [Trichonephila clavipes]
MLSGFELPKILLLPRNAGHHSRVVRRKPYISMTNRLKQIAFEKIHIHKPLEFWRTVIFSDEGKFCIFGIKGYKLIWRKPCTALQKEHLVLTVKHGGGGVMVWRGIFYMEKYLISHEAILPGNEVADDLAKAAASDPVDSEDTWSFRRPRSTYRAKELICNTWVVPPVHPCYFKRHPGSTISFKGSRSYQPAFSRFSTVHLRCINFEGDKRSSPMCTKCNISPFSPQHILQCLGFSCEEVIAPPPPAVLGLSADLWAHGFGLVSQDQTGMSPNTTTTKFNEVHLQLQGPSSHIS